MSIKVENITKLYGKQKALDNVSFSVGEGEIVGFLGPNGAGKSTMMKILTCYIPQNSGKAYVCEHDVEKESIEVRKKIGYLPENNPLYLDMYVKEYLGFVANIHGTKRRKEQVDNVIELTGLTKEHKKKIGALSKGYRQRVGLAQALIHDPEVLILDEPTTGLDPNQLEEIRSLIKEVGKDKTVLFSTHIMQEVEAVCDKVIIINSGKIIADDATSAIKSSGATKAIITVEFDKSVQEKDLLSIDHVEQVVNTDKNIWKISCAVEIDIRPTIFEYAVNNRLTVLTIQKEERKLEEVFKELTTKNER